VKIITIIVIIIVITITTTSLLKDALIKVKGAAGLLNEV